MPIVVACPACGGKLSAPEAAVGKQVRCPRAGCGAVTVVPAFVEAAPAPPPPPPKSKPVKAAVADDGDDDRPRRKPRRDDGDDGDDRPRARTRRRRDDDDDYEFDRRRPRRKKSGASARVIVAVVIGGLLVLGGVGYGVYALVGKKKPALPTGWVEYTSKEDNFKAYFPGEPAVNRVGGVGGGPFGGGGPASVAEYTAQSASGSVRVKVEVRRVPGGIPREAREKMEEVITNPRLGMREGGMEVRTVRWLGFKGVEVTGRNMMGRAVLTDDAVYTAEIGTRTGGRATPEEEKAFFDGFELLK